MGRGVGCGSVDVDGVDCVCVCVGVCDVVCGGEWVGIGGGVVDGARRRFDRRRRGDFG